jgi:3-oxoacyl-[acyl-carrier protein] reductase
MLLNQKRVLITGGSRGIGKAIVERFAEEGAHVLFTYKSNMASALDIVERLSAKGYHVHTVKADVSQQEDCKALVKHVQDTFGGLDVLVNNAGITRDTLMLRMSLEQFDDVVNTNLRGVWMLTQALLKPLLKSEKGKIINISSVSGILGNAGQTNYSAAKAGVIGLTKALARELGGRNINVNAIAPGFTKTEMTDKVPQEIIDQALAQIPLKRMGDVKDIANAALFLASNQSDYITGQTLVVDGGMVMPS